MLPIHIFKKLKCHFTLWNTKIDKNYMLKVVKTLFYGNNCWTINIHREFKRKQHLSRKQINYTSYIITHRNAVKVVGRLQEADRTSNKAGKYRRRVCGLWFVVCGLWFVVCGCSLVARATGRQVIEAGSIPWCGKGFSSQNNFYHDHHHHQSLNREGRWGTTDDFETSFLHFPLFSTALWDLPNSRPVHSLMLSSHLFL